MLTSNEFNPKWTIVRFGISSPLEKSIRTARTEIGVCCRESRDFLPILHGGRVSEKSLGVSTLQAVEPPCSVNNGPIK